MIRRPPRSPLFPSTPLFRSGRTRREVLQGGAGLAAASILGGWWLEAAAAAPPVSAGFEAGPVQHLLPTVTHDRIRLKARSEEHTSELQSRQYLVCRLLLEKK